MIDKFSTILPNFYRGQILSAVRLKICPPQTKFVRSQQNVLTCEALAMIENLSK